ncbi:carboxymuconolactone decarboxylase family protein [Actinoplanes sp. CA-054009]
MTTFPIHTVESAPDGSRAALETLKGALGFVPNLAATMAGAPSLISTFVAAFGQFAGAGFTGAERQILLLTNAVTNRCAWAVAFHSTAALAEGATSQAVAAVRHGELPDDPRLAALSATTRALIDKRGHLDQADLKTFTAGGFDETRLLDVVTGLAVSTMAAVQVAIDAILAQQEPHPAVVMDRDWTIRDTNPAADRLFGLLLTGHDPIPGPPNVLRLMFHPDGVRRYVTNWPEVARALTRRVRREALGGVTDDRAQRILAEVLACPGVPASIADIDPLAPQLPLVPVRFARDGHRWDYFSTVTTLGTPQDVTLQELRIECFFPSGSRLE